MITTLLTVALASIELEPAPEVGVESVVTVTRDQRAARGETVRVLHNPGTSFEYERAIGITDARGRATWTPEIAGTYELRAGIERQRGRLSYPRPPADTLALLLLLLLSALGLSLVGLRKQARAL